MLLQSLRTSKRFNDLINNYNMNRLIVHCGRTTVLFFIVLFAGNSVFAQIPHDYKGRPYVDSVFTQGAQIIPGRIELALYDLGGPGVAYSDSTPQNEGAALNRTDGHWRPGITAQTAFFRENEGVDISYTKDWADFNHPNKVDPKVNQLYIGWQQDGNGQITQ
jgi:hypothetical protein